MIARPWEREEVFHSGSHYFSEMEKSLAAAENSIEVESYIYENDALGRTMARAFMNAAARGVDVRIMVDGVGSPAWSIQFMEELDRAGVEARVYHPLPWALWSFLLRKQVRESRRLNLFQTMNRRNHRKAFIIDRRVAWVGSMNISACHLDRSEGGEGWRDSGARVEGPPVAHLAAAFEKAWREARGLKRGRKRFSRQRFMRKMETMTRRWAARARNERKYRIVAGKMISPVRLNDNRMRRRRHYKDLLARIAQARRRVWITNAYFVPDGSLLKALRFAAWSGADVRVMVPRKSDIFFMKWVTAAFYGSLLKSGVRVFEYLPSVLHAKTALVDDWALVGSTNLNYRSLVHNLELDVVLTRAESVSSMEEQFVKDLTHSREVSLSDWKRMGWLQRMAGAAALLFKYWI